MVRQAGPHPSDLGRNHGLYYRRTIGRKIAHVRKNELRLDPVRPAKLDAARPRVRLHVAVYMTITGIPCSSKKHRRGQNGNYVERSADCGLSASNVVNWCGDCCMPAKYNPADTLMPL